MSESPYPVGYRRPPVHSRFQKGQSGNPGGKAGPEKLLKHQLEAALSEALNADEDALRTGTPATVMDSFVRQIALDAVGGKIASQRLVVFIAERESREAIAALADETSRRLSLAGVQEENGRKVMGERYDELKQRFDAAVASGSVDDLLELAEDFDEAAKFPASGNS